MIDMMTRRTNPGRAAAAVLVLLLAAAAAFGAGTVPGPAPAAATAAGAAALPPDRPIENFPDSAEIRARYWDSYFSAPRATALARPPAVIRSGTSAFRLSSVDAKDYFYQIVAQIPPGAKAEEFPLYAQGTWILKRTKLDGAPVQAKVFLRTDPGCFLRIYPDGDRCRMDLVVYGGVMNREVPLPLPFDRVFSSSLADLVAWTEGIVDWELFSPHPGMYSGLRSFVAAVRSRLPALRYAEDGALDAEGRPVYIANGAPQAAPAGLNCSGFAKWIVDGFYYPLAGSYLDLRAMAERRSELRASTYATAYEAKLDPYFGLDWTRNLGTAMADAAESSRRHGDKENDVADAPFALVAAPAQANRDSAAVNGSSIYEDYPAVEAELGYEMRGLKALLYWLAIEDPGSIYLASLSRKDGGALNSLRRHYHVAVLAPYFEPDGSFRVAVFESAAETSLEALTSRAAKDFVHLVRVRVLPDFEPPALR